MFSNTINIQAKKSLIRSHLLYCSQIWHPYLLRDIAALEQLQCCSTKFILNNYVSDYKTRLIKLNMLPSMYYYDLSDILFFIKSLKFPSSHFDISIITQQDPLPATNSNTLHTVLLTSRKIIISTDYQKFTMLFLF